MCMPVCNTRTDTYMSFSRYTVRLWWISMAIGSGEKTINFSMNRLNFYLMAGKIMLYKAVQRLRDKRNVAGTVLRDLPGLQSATWIRMRKIIASVVAKLAPELTFFRSTTFHLSYVTSAALPLYFQAQGLVPEVCLSLCLHSSDASSVRASSNSGWFVCSQSSVWSLLPARGKMCRFPQSWRCLRFCNQIPWNRLAALAFNFQ